MRSYRASEAFRIPLRSQPAAQAGVSVPAEGLAWHRGFVADGRAVLEAFRDELDAGTLKRAQHASLRAIEGALAAVPAPFSGPPPSLRAGARPPRLVDRHSGAAAGSAAGLPERCPPPGVPRPAADLTPGDDRHLHVQGRPGDER